MRNIMLVSNAFCGLLIPILGIHFKLSTFQIPVTVKG